MKKIINYSYIDYEPERVILRDKEGSAVDIIYVENLVEDYLDSQRDIKYVQKENYEANEEEIIEE